MHVPEPGLQLKALVEDFRALHLSFSLYLATSSVSFAGLARRSLRQKFQCLKAVWVCVCAQVTLLQACYRRRHLACVTSFRLRILLRISGVHFETLPGAFS